FTAGRRKCWGEPGWHFRMGHLTESHPVFFVPALHTCAFGILQRQLELARQRIDGRTRALPHALALEPHVPDPASPRGNHAADRTVVGAVGVLLVESSYDIGCDTNEGTQRSGRFDAVFPARPGGAKHDGHLLEVVHEE